jgi:hypothetical protein
MHNYLFKNLFRKLIILVIVDIARQLNVQVANKGTHFLNIVILCQTVILLPLLFFQFKAFALLLRYNTTDQALILLSLLVLFLSDFPCFRFVLKLGELQVTHFSEKTML